MHSCFYKLAVPAVCTAVFFIVYLLISAYPPADHSVPLNIRIPGALTVSLLTALSVHLALKRRLRPIIIRRAAKRPFLHIEVVSDLGNSLLLVLSNAGQDDAKYIRISCHGSMQDPFLPNMIRQLPANNQYFALIENRPECSQSFSLVAKYQDSCGNAYSETLNIELPSLPKPLHEQNALGSVDI